MLREPLYWVWLTCIASVVIGLLLFGVKIALQFVVLQYCNNFVAAVYIAG